MDHGWQAWLEGDFARAEAHLEEAVAREALAEAAYWRGRVQLRLGRADAVARFESVLRLLGGSAQAAVWLVDLLARSGRLDRAEQVWKTLRGNRRAMACAEAPLVEARFQLGRGELMPAERSLQQMTPSSALGVERLLLLAWVRTAQKRGDEARAYLQQARQGPYPAAALAEWTERIEERLGGARAAVDAASAPPSLRDYLAGQYENALNSPLAQPFARYALVCLGKEDPAALLASSPGLFLAARCRARLTLDRFRLRQATAAELLDVARQAAAVDYHSPRLEHFRRLALALQERNVNADQLRLLASESANGLRAAIELAVRDLPRDAQRSLLLEWANSPLVSGDETLRLLLERQILRLVLLASGACQRPASKLQGVDTPRSPGVVELEQASQQLAAGLSEEEREPWRQWVRRLRGTGRLRGLAQGLLMQEACERGDARAVAALLDERETWRGLGPLPPTFVLRAVEHVALTQQSSSWRRSLARWLEVWDPEAIKARAETLLVQADLLPLSAEKAQPPPGVPEAGWLLHQAARALSRDDARTALALVRRALTLTPDNALARAALPELERRARAEALAKMLQDSCDPAESAGELADLVDLLESLPEGQAILKAAESGDSPEAWARLEEMALRDGLPGRLAHHLALVYQRRAGAQGAEAIHWWQLSWRCWLRYLEAEDIPARRRVLLDWLLAQHRQQIKDLLARNAVEQARACWKLVQQLLELTGDESLRQDMAQRVARFRDELATEYLVATREAMRYGNIPEGWRGDYDKGLAYLRRLLSLDGDNVRLLSVLVEICTEWLFDLSLTGEMSLLRQQLERVIPFALRLARLIEDRPGELTARAALANLWKVRGLLTADRQQQRAFFEEALRFNPANAEAAHLLAELEPSIPKEQDQ